MCITKAGEAMKIAYVSYAMPLKVARYWLSQGGEQLFEAVTLLVWLREQYPHALDVGHELALALLESGKSEEAETLVQVERAPAHRAQDHEPVARSEEARCPETAELEEKASPGLGPARHDDERLPGGPAGEKPDAGGGVRSAGEDPVVAAPAQILPGGDGDPLEILERADGCRIHAGLVEEVTVVADVPVGVTDQ